MRLSRWKATATSFFLAAILVVPALGANSDTHSALPGTVNYVEGQASIGNEMLDAHSVGSAELQTGQTLTGFVSADVAAPYGRFAEVVDRLRTEGITEIALDTKPTGEAAGR